MKRMTAKVDIAPVSDCPAGGYSALFQVPERASARRRSASCQNRESYHDIVATIFEHNTEVMEEMLIKNSKAGDLAQIALILQRRAEVLFNIDAKDPATGNTALMWAASNGHSKIVQLLLRHGADVTARNNDSVTAIELTSPLLRQMLLESVEQGGAHNALCQAAWQGNASLLKKIMAHHSVNVNCQNADHLSPILLATRDIQLFEKLGSFASGANYSPVEVIRELLNHGADLSVTDENQMTALHYICSGTSSVSSSIALCLLKAGANPDARDRNNSTPLHYASQKGNMDIVVALLDGGSDPNAKDLSGTTPLHLTARHGHDQATLVLVQHGADIFVADGDGLTPLDVAKNKAIKVTLHQAWMSSSRKTKENTDTCVETKKTNKGMEMSQNAATGGSLKQTKNDVRRSSSSDSESVIGNGATVGSTNYSRHLNSNMVAFHPSHVKPHSDQHRQTTSGRIRFGSKGMACHPTPQSPRNQRRGPCRVTFPDTDDPVENKKVKDSQKTCSGCINRWRIKVKLQSGPYPEGQSNETERQPTVDKQFEKDEHTKFLPHLSQNSPGPVTATDQAGSRLRNSDEKPLMFEDLNPDAPGELTASSNKDSKTGSARFPKPSSCPVICQTPGVTDRSSPSTNKQSPRNSDAQSFSPKYISRLASIFFTDIDQVYGSALQKEESGIKLIEVDDNSPEDWCTSSAAKSSGSPLHFKPFKSILREGNFNIDDTRVRKSDDSGYPDDGTENSNSISSSSSTSNVSTSLDTQDLSGGRKTSLAKDTSKTGVQGTFKEQANLCKNYDVSSSAEFHRDTGADSGIKVTRVKRHDCSGTGENRFTFNPIIYSKEVENSVKTTMVLVKPPVSSSALIKPTLTPPSVTESSAKLVSANVPLEVSESANEDALPVAPPRQNGSFKEKNQIANSKSNESLSSMRQSELHPETDNQIATKCQTKQSTQTTVADTKTQAVNVKQQDLKGMPVMSTSTGNSVYHRTGRSASCGPANKGTAASPAETDAIKKTAQLPTNTLKQNRCDKKVSSTVPAGGKIEGSSHDLRTEQRTKAVHATAANEPAKERLDKHNLSIRRVVQSPAVASDGNVSVDVARSLDNSSSPSDNVECFIPCRSASFRHRTSRDGNRLRHSGSETSNCKDLQTDLSVKIGNSDLPRSIFPEKQSTHNKTTAFKSLAPSKEMPLHRQSHCSTQNRLPGNHSKSQQSPTSENQPSFQKSTTSESNSLAQKSTASDGHSSSNESCASENLVPSSKSSVHATQTSAQKLVRTQVRATATNVKTTSNLAGIGTDKRPSHSDESVHVLSSDQTPDVAMAEDGSYKLPVQSKVAIIIKQIRSSISYGERQKFTGQKINNSLGKNTSVDVVEKHRNVASSISKYIPAKNTCSIVDTSSHKPTSSVCGAQTEDHVNKQESTSVLSGNSSHKNSTRPDECPVLFRDTRTKQKGNEDLGESLGQSDVTQNGSELVELPVKSVNTKPVQIIYTGPVICDPFESLKLRQEYAMVAAKMSAVEMPESSKSHTPVPLSAKQRSQTVSSAKSRQQVPQQPKKTKTARQTSASRGISAARVKSKPKSGRRERNRRKSKNCSELNSDTSREEELLSGPNVKLIGGIGWHVAARPVDVQTKEQNVEAAVLRLDSETTRSSSQFTRLSLGESSHSQDLNESVVREQSEERSLLPTTGPDDHRGKACSRKKFSRAEGVANTFSVSECSTSQTDQLLERLVPDPVLLPRETGRSSGTGIGLQVAKSGLVEAVALSEVAEEAEEEVTVKVFPATPRNEISANSVDNQQNGASLPVTGSNGISGNLGTKYNNDLDEVIREILETSPNPSLTSSMQHKWKTEPEMREDSNQDNSILSSRNNDHIPSSCCAVAPNLSGTETSGEVWSDGSVTGTIREKRGLKKGKMQSGIDDHGSSFYESLISGKPPLAIRTSATSSVIDQSFQALERSPRFVRKHDSFTRLNRPNSQSTSENENSETWVTEMVHSNLQHLDDSLMSRDQNAKLVTTRLGRSCTQSRTASTISSVPSSACDDVETIQWKRGNMLGKGAYGTVWCGLTNSGEMIAVKMIELNTSNLEKAEAEYEQIQEEVELLKTLKHKNIVGYLGTSLEDNFVSIFMQFVPGGSIASIIARFGSLEEEVFCNYTKQILEGVEYLHANNVIHRDIKGGNIMVTHNGIIKLIDFGCAKKLCLNITSLSADQSPLLKSMRGTPYWMAPEVVREDGHGVQSDIWSIGCTVFEMATKKPPWSEYPPAVAIFTIGCDSKPIPQLPSKFSENARSFVNACLTRDPSKRSSATQLLRHSFIINRKRPKTSCLS